MARKRQFPAEEAAVCARLREFRLKAGIAQGVLARLIGVSPSLLYSYEAGRVQVNYAVAWRILNYFPDLNPEWLAEGPPHSMLGLRFVEYPEPAKSGYGPRASFLAVFNGVLRGLILCSNATLLTEEDQEHQWFRLPESGEGGARAVILMGAVIRRWIAQLPESEVNGFLNRVVKEGGRLLKQFPEVDRDQWKRRFDELRWQELRRLAALQNIGGDSAPDFWPRENILQGLADSGNVASVKAQWPKLKARLQQATKPKGKRSELAAFLGVALTGVSRWLSDREDSREPGAETALQMIQWLDREPK